MFQSYDLSQYKGGSKIFEFSENLPIALLESSHKLEECKRLKCIEFKKNKNNHFKVFFKNYP